MSAKINQGGKTNANSKWEMAFTHIEEIKKW